MPWTHVLTIVIVLTLPGISLFALGKKVLGVFFLGALLGLFFFSEIYFPHLSRKEWNTLFVIGAVFWSAQVCITLGYAWRMVRTGKRESRASAAESVSDLAPGITREVRGASGIVPALLMLAVFGYFTLFSFMHPAPPWIKILGLLMLALLVLFTLRILPLVGQPILTLSREGFSTPRNGFIPWEAVQGISLKKSRYRIAADISLVFLIPDLERYVPQFSSFDRGMRVLLAPAERIMLSILLRGTGETPEEVYEMARHLWTAQTGMSHAWDPELSEEANQALRRLGENQAHSPGEALQQAEADRRLIAREKRNGKIFTAAVTVILIIGYMIVRAALK